MVWLAQKYQSRKGGAGMKSVLPVSLVMGVVVGLLVGAYFNVFNVPVMEWAITLEEAAAAAEAPTGEPEEEGIAISLGVQRIGMVAGLAVLGVLFGAVFTGLYHLVRLASPGWNMWAWSSIAGFLGFWAISLFAQLKYPLNPPGIGEGTSLLARQGFQFLFIAISILAVIGVCIAVRKVVQSQPHGSGRWLGLAGIAVAYAVVSIVAFLLIPGNPDAIPEWVPEGLVIMFRSFTVIGHFLLWMGIALGVTGYIRYKEKGICANPASADRVSVG